MDKNATGISFQMMLAFLLLELVQYHILFEHQVLMLPLLPVTPFSKIRFQSSCFIIFRFQLLSVVYSRSVWSMDNWGVKSSVGYVWRNFLSCVLRDSFRVVQNVHSLNIICCAIHLFWDVCYVWFTDWSLQIDRFQSWAIAPVSLVIIFWIF